MRDEYDFSDGKRGAVIKPRPKKTRITIRIDDDILDWFRAQAHAAGGGSYQTMMNDALRQFIQAGYEPIEERVRQVVREELKAYGPPKAED